MPITLGDQVKLDLACGQNKQEGFTGLDQVPCKGVDFVCDLSTAPWRLYPIVGGRVAGLGQILDDDSVDEVYCSHFFEHLDGPERMAFMDEMWRVMKVGAQARIIVPYGSSHRAVQDPTHKWPPVVENSFLYFWKKWRVENGLDHYPITCNFYYTFEPAVYDEWTIRSQDARSFGMKHYNNVVSDLYVFLVKMSQDQDEILVSHAEVGRSRGEAG